MAGEPYKKKVLLNVDGGEQNYVELKEIQTTYGDNRVLFTMGIEAQGQQQTFDPALLTKNMLGDLAHALQEAADALDG